MGLVPDFVSSRPKTFGLYGTFIVGAIYIYRSLQTQATGKYDYVLTLSAGLQALAFALLVLDTKSQVAEGISEKALWAFMIAHISRLSTTVWGEGYVPEDSTSKFYLYQICEVSGVVLLMSKILSMTTLRTIHDSGGMERWTILVGMVVTSVVLAYVTKSTGHDDFFADYLWMFSTWMEAFALLPQVQLLWKASNQLDESAVHFAGMTLAASLAFAGFWTKNASDNYAHFMSEGYHSFMYGIIACAIIRVALCACYFYLFTRHPKTFKGLRGGKGEYELCMHDEEL